MKSRFGNIVLCVFAVIIFLIGLIMISAPEGRTYAVMIVLVSIVLFAMGILGYKRVGKMKKEVSNRMENLGALASGEFKHVNGLPIAENVGCKVYYCKNHIMFESSGNEINLDFDKIQDIQISTDKEIQKALVSSVGGAVGGAVLFGPLGAMIGGRTKTKKVETISNYLIITYNKDGEVSHIGFEVTGGMLNAEKIVKLFKSNVPKKVNKINM